jgi:hypothetical protein
MGKAALRRAVKIAAPIARTTWKGVTEGERKTLAAIIAKVLNNLKQMGPLPIHAQRTRENGGPKEN